MVLLLCALLFGQVFQGQPCGCKKHVHSAARPSVKTVVKLVHDTVFIRDTVAVENQSARMENDILRVALDNQKDRANSAWMVAALFANRCDTLKLDNRAVEVVIHDERQLLMPYIAGGVRASPHTDPDWLAGAGAQFIYGRIGFDCLASLELVPVIETTNGTTTFSGAKRIGTIVQGILKIYVY